MINKEQLTNEVIQPLLHLIPKGLSWRAVTAIEMIIAHESKRGEFLKQVGGPAMGWIMMEPPIYYTVWAYGQTVWYNAYNAGLITKHEYKYKFVPPIERLLYDLRFNIFMARQRLFMKPGLLPETPAEISIYLKKFWNSPSGAAQEDSYLKDWLLWD